FFFQAEDGIRDFHVTGVQTCALPIYPSDSSSLARSCSLHPFSCSWSHRQLRQCGQRECVPKMAEILRFWPQTAISSLPTCLRPRSEERRVGKECRAR